MSRTCVALALSCLLGAGGTASADTLLVDRTQARPAAALPAHGQHSSEVEARFGAPVRRLEPRGGQKRQWPAIQRWEYPSFTVYFERERVIDAVVHRASPGEAGPKPAIR